MKEIKYFEVKLGVDGLSGPAEFITHIEPFVNSDGFVEIQLSDGVHLFDRGRVWQMTVKPITE